MGKESRRQKLSHVHDQHRAAGIGSCAQNGITIPSFLPRRCIWKFLRPLGISELECKLPNTLALQWIKEIEAAKSLDDLITPKSITDKDFPNFEELDLMMAAALKRCYEKQTHFRKKISVEEQRAQKDRRSPRGRQIAFFVCEYFRPTGFFGEIQGLLGFFSFSIGKDDFQDFDSHWEPALLLTSDLPSDKVLEGMYVSKLQDFSQVQTNMALLYNQEILRRKRKTRLSQNENVCVCEIAY